LNVTLSQKTLITEIIGLIQAATLKYLSIWNNIS